MNQHLAQVFERDVNAIKNLRKTQAYKSLRERIEEEELEAADVEPVSSTVPPLSPAPRPSWEPSARCRARSPDDASACGLTPVSHL